MTMRLQALASASLLALLACSDLNEIAEPDEVMVLTASPESIPANGYSVSQITARVSPQADQRLRDVIFSTTLGRFPAADPATPQVLVATAGVEGSATVALQSSPQVGRAVVSAEIRDGQAVKIARSLEVQFAGVSPTDVISLSTASQTAPADGATPTEIFARISEAVPLLQRSILFTTTAGNFGAPNQQQVSRTASSNNVASAELVSPRTPGVALVTATLNNIQATTAVSFEPALPDQISVSVFGSLQVKATFQSKITVEAKLERFVGQVTPGTEAVFRCFDESTGNTFGFWSGVNLSDAQGMVTAEFTPGNTAERGEATIRVRVPGNEVSGRVRIEIVNP
jgi:hypothetical protein